MTRQKKRQLARIITLAALVVLIMGLLTGCEDTEETRRYQKTIESRENGLNRTISVYSENGKLLREYHGKVDIEDNDTGNKVLFDNDGKRYIIYGGTVIIEETKE